MPGGTKGFGTVAEAMRSVDRATARKNKARERLAAEVVARVPGEGYEPCIVSFIDVLGFRDLLATRHAHDIRDVLLHLRKFTAPTEELRTRRMKDARLLSRAFADSVSDAVVRVRVFDTQFSDGAFFCESACKIGSDAVLVVPRFIVRRSLAPAVGRSSRGHTSDA